MNTRFPTRALALAAATACLPAFAQTAPTATLSPVVVTGNPLASDSLTTPASVLTGAELVLRRGSTLGDTLDGLPGVAATNFGPNASRPVIRGLDGDRVRMLSNAGASLDASSLSFDHAVPLEPLLATRIEVLRGPAALLYGGSAIGGVVNVIDNRIPSAPQPGVAGAAELRGGGAAREKAAVASLDAGGDGFALHADAFDGSTSDLRTPDYDRPDGEGGFTRESRVINSASDAQGGALGGSWIGSRGHLGLAWDTYRNDYGVVAEEDVTIRMQRDKLALAGELRFDDGFVRRLSGRVQHTDYEHQEVEGSGEVGTTFTTKGTDYRLELRHAPLGALQGALQGVIGLQGEDADFSALGEEAFVPNTRTRQFAGFVYEELTIGAGARLNFGGRFERSEVDSAGDPADAAEPKFGAAQSRSFNTGSASAGVVWPLGGGWQASANLAWTERAPTFYELYAGGVHVATGTFERGNVDQAKERSRNLDLGLEWRAGVHTLAKASLFASDFSNYIALLATGEPDFVNDEGESFPVYAFQGVRARFVGGELEGKWRALSGRHTLDLDAGLDWVRADNRSTGEPLPRIAPLRATLAAGWSFAGWTLRGELRHATEQDRVPVDEVATPSATLLNLALFKSFGLAGSEGLAWLRLDNVTDELAYNATTIASVRPLSPLGGRAVRAGVRLAF